MHFANIAVHVVAGSIALVIGFLILLKEKGTAGHQRLGLAFLWMTLLVCATAAIGTIFFRFLPAFAVLSLLVPYQLFGGWRAVRTRERGPMRIDAGALLIALLLALPLTMEVLGHGRRLTAVDYSAVGALGLILAYDAAKWTFPRSWHGAIWRYEHSYKMTASVFAMLSALIGNVVRIGQPWSQLAPSVIGLVVIAVSFVRLGQRQMSGKESL
ncbi:DUF2306 domain-containing protein [Stenotrophomonas pigmentata]|uniref:hypothetical protein n=1 Tax=Stenotrophomonas pigmentata TaxID=3055080 RepID=UPI0026ED2062|nr:hypothetical protein [Stenotrophomonas sp. 610A2]